MTVSFLQPRSWLFGWALLGAVAMAHGAAPRLSIAAAANFVYALDALNAEFKRTAPDVIVTTTVGSTGNLFAQIRQGAPFDVFLAADTDYPRQMVAAGLAKASTLRTFATGRLVLWSTRSGADVSDLAATLRAPWVNKIAIAQPLVAPYGRAAQAALEKLGVWSDLRSRLVFGESISQTAQFVETGNADLGFIAMSLVLSPRLTARGTWKEIPPDWYAKISLDHAAVLTNRGTENPVAERYLQFLASEPARKILRDFGYGLPK